MLYGGMLTTPENNWRMRGARFVQDISMMRIKKIIFDALTALSLLLLVATAGLWTRSYWATDYFFWQGRRVLPNTELAVLRGRLVLCFEAVMIVGVTAEKWEWRDGFSHGAVRPSIDDTSFFGRPSSAELSVWRKIGFRDDYIRSPREPIGSAWECPCWFVCLLYCLLPARRLVLWLRQRRRRTSGLCPTCGYDLRASKDRCPECGTVMAVTTGAPKKPRETIAGIPWSGLS